jgi:hypothetical protein
MPVSSGAHDTRETHRVALFSRFVFSVLQFEANKALALFVFSALHTYRGVGTARIHILLERIVCLLFRS